MILVVGSTGKLGTEICHILACKGFPIRALIRPTSDPQRVEWLKNYGSELILGDLRHPASLVDACRGVHAVICTASALSSYQPFINDFKAVDLEGILNLIDVAREAGVPHFIFISLSRNIDLESPLRNAKRAVEKHLRESGMVYTVLSPAFFMETWFSRAVGFDPIAEKAIVYGDGKNPICWISYRDVAQFAVSSLSNPLAYDATLELVGPQALSPCQVIRIFEEASHRNFKLTYVPEKTLREQLKVARDPLQQTWASLRLCCAHGDAAVIPKPLFPCPNRPISVLTYSKTLSGLN
jgi:uncharacterized protein YbjT (DUF2867 family)